MALDVPFASQETLLCVPTSASMVLAYYGDTQPPRKLKALAEGRAYDQNQPFTDFSITSFNGLVRGVERLGYAWRAESFPMTAEGFEVGMTVIRADLGEKHPPLVDISIKGVGHTLVVSGFDDQRRLLNFVDPAEPAPGRKVATYAQFEAAWNETAYGGRFRAISRTKPKARTAAAAL